MNGNSTPTAQEPRGAGIRPAAIGLFLLVMVAFALTACGGGESRESAALKEEQKAGELFVEGNGAGFCEQLTGKESRAIIEKYGKEVGSDDCGKIMDAIFKLIGPDEVATLEEEQSEITTDDVKVHGKTATIEWPHSDPDELIEAGGHWYLNDKGEVE
jgi:hypothetical protein